LLLDVVSAAGGTIVTDVFHAFSPHGLSGVIVIAESHVAVHTWPEYGFMAVDVFSCSAKLEVELIEVRLTEALKPSRCVRRQQTRG
jgi:S-adenosylmethionine decarboxylase